MKVFSHVDAEEKKTVDINQAVESTVTVCRNEWKYCANMEIELEEDLQE